MKQLCSKGLCVSVIICVLISFLACDSGNTEQGSSEQGLIHLRTVQIMDTQGWGQPVPAKSLLVPVGWHTRGGVGWRLSVCPYDLIVENFMASTPDGQIAFETLPAYAWQWGNDQISQAGIRMSGCRLAPPRSAEQVLQDIVASYRGSAYIRSSERSLEAAKGVYDELYGLYGYVYNMQGITLNTDAIRAVIEYQRDGINYEEWITFSWIEATAPSMVAMPTYTYWIKDITAFRAPKGQLAGHERLFSTMLSSMRDNPVWQTAFVQLLASVSAQASIAAGSRAAIWSGAMNQIGETMIKTWHQNQNTYNKISKNWSRAFRGVDHYRDSDTGLKVELPVGYKSAWSDSMGGYVLSPNPSFNPNTDSTLKQQNWRRLKLQQ